MERKLSRDEWYELQDQLERTPGIPDGEGVPGEHIKLIALLNRFGFYPGSKQEALNLAKNLLDQGWGENIES